jgi:5-oxoprolinase (ATP-hydrolysing) subunit A
MPVEPPGLFTPVRCRYNTAMRIDLNCDMGESFGTYRLGDDEALMPLITSANVACGFHAGDPLVLERTVRLAQAHAVAVGAHPGYPDLSGFGRRDMALSPKEIEAAVLYQIGAVAAFCRAFGLPLVHVKAHGALYNAAARDPGIARAIARSIARFDRNLIMLGLASSPAMAEAAAAEGLRYAREAFADRMYNPDGTLQARSVPGSLIIDPAAVGEQAVQIARGSVVASNGASLPIQAETLCLHGDNPSAVANARAVRSALAAAGIEVRALAA